MLVFLALLILFGHGSSSFVSAVTNGWQKSGSTWYYYSNSVKQTGWKQIKGIWYYFGSDGVMCTGWKQIKGIWYYFGAGGAMQTGWKHLGSNWYFFGAGGAMLTGWQKIGSNWYFFGAGGAMQTGWKHIGGKWYLFGNGGAMLTGWQKTGSSWYYLGSNGVMRTGWQQISGKWYYFNASGVMQTGWIRLSGKWYYLESSGAMKTGWLQYNNHWYYLKSDGSMAVSEIIGQYTFNASGHWIVTVDPSLPLTRDNLLLLLDQYDPDGAYIIRNSDENLVMRWLEGDTLGEACLNRSISCIAVHEQCHNYTIGYSKKDLIYIGGGEGIFVNFTDVFDSREMAETVPEELKTTRFSLYIDTDERVTSRVGGVYGILNEFTAYCWGINTENCLYDYLETNNMEMRSGSDGYLAYAEFKFYTLHYLLYARDHYPDIYKDILANESYRRAFRLVDDKYQSVSELNREKQPFISSSFDVYYQALMNKISEKEYQDIEKLLRQ